MDVRPSPHLPPESLADALKHVDESGKTVNVTDRQMDFHD
jgi:predicted oxidoreductase